MRIRQMWTQFRILHAALLASVVIYGVVVMVVSQQPGPPPSTDLTPAVMLPVFGGLSALGLLVIVPLLRRTLMPPRESFPQGVDLDDELDDRVAAALLRLRMAQIISLALCETVAMFGLIASFLTREPRYYPPFAVVAAIGMLVYGPRRVVLDEVVRAARSGAVGR